MKKNKLITYSHQSGFTLLFAILVSTLIVSISATIISIALRQTILSSTSRESQYAFYVANTAVDCAHYWDTKQLDEPNVFVFPSPVPEGFASELAVEDDNNLKQNIRCSDVNIITGAGYGTGYNGWTQDNDDDIKTTEFKLKIKNNAGNGDIPNLPTYEYCADVTLTKELDEGEGRVITRIESKGYNTCDENNTRRVERSIIQEY